MKKSLSFYVVACMIFTQSGQAMWKNEQSPNQSNLPKEEKTTSSFTRNPMQGAFHIKQKDMELGSPQEWGEKIEKMLKATKNTLKNKKYTNEKLIDIEEKKQKMDVLYQENQEQQKKLGIKEEVKKSDLEIEHSFLEQQQNKEKDITEEEYKIRREDIMNKYKNITKKYKKKSAIYRMQKEKKIEEVTNILEKSQKEEMNLEKEIEIKKLIDIMREQQELSFLQEKNITEFYDNQIQYKNNCETQENLHKELHDLCRKVNASFSQERKNLIEGGLTNLSKISNDFRRISSIVHLVKLKNKEENDNIHDLLSIKNIKVAQKISRLYFLLNLNIKEKSPGVWIKDDEGTTLNSLKEMAKRLEKGRKDIEKDIIKILMTNNARGTMTKDISFATDISENEPSEVTYKELLDNIRNILEYMENDHKSLKNEQSILEKEKIASQEKTQDTMETVQAMKDLKINNDTVSEGDSRAKTMGTEIQEASEELAQGGPLDTTMSAREDIPRSNSTEGLLKIKRQQLKQLEKERQNASGGFLLKSREELAQQKENIEKKAQEIKRIKEEIQTLEKSVMEERTDSTTDCARKISQKASEVEEEKEWRPQKK